MTPRTKCVINGTTHKLDPKDTRTFLGQGGEAAVYKIGGQAVKVFHDSDSSDSTEEQKRRYLALQLKAKKLQAFPTGLPSEVLAPTGLVHNAKGKIIGYTMPLLGNMDPIWHLADKDKRATLTVTQEAITELFKRFHAVLCALHGKGIIVGDLNDGNEMVSFGPQGSDIRIIDADSFQFNGFPCTVAAERFLDPRRYGEDLSLGLFDTDTDWFAYAVLLFQSIFCTQPYQGLHKKYRTYLRRAEARVSILHDSVKWKNPYLDPGHLPDDLMHHFVQMFEKDIRGVFPEALLAGLRWTSCTKCGVEHARKVCPNCAAPGAVVEAIRFNRACKATRVFETTGTIRALRVVLGRLCWVYQEGDNAYRETKMPVIKGGIPPHTLFSIEGNATWIGANTNLLRIENQKLTGRQTTCQLGNLPMFDSTPSHVYRVQGGSLMRSDKVIGQVINENTWFRAGDHFGFGFNRAGGKWFFYLFDHEKVGTKLVDLPSPTGKVRGVDAVFDQKHVLFSIAEDRSGKMHHTMYLIKRDGTLVAKTEGDPDDERMLASIQGKCLFSGAILVPTDEGLLLVKPNGSRLEEVKLFTDTEPFVSEDSKLFATPQGGVWVASDQSIWLLELK